MQFESRGRKPNDERESKTPGVLPQLPLGSNAFRSPLFASSERGASNRGPWVILTGAVVLSASILGLALAFRPTTETIERDEEVVARVPRPAVTAKPHAAARSRTPVAPAAASAAVLPASEASELVFAPAPKKAAHAARHARGRRGSATHEARRAGTRSRKAARESVAASKLPEAPSRASVLAAMTRVTPAALACFGDERGVAKVTLFVRGKTGRVSHARVTGIAGSAGSCIARAVRRATFPKFQKDKLEISYPFKR